MSTMQRAINAYSFAATTRGLKEQEAEIFRQVNAGLARALETKTDLSLVRAIADNHRLWLTVIGAVRDPTNLLPPTLRAAIASVGAAVQREMKRETPNLPFLIEVNENLAAGLTGVA